jgi:hypothetical protein
MDANVLVEVSGGSAQRLSFASTERRVFQPTYASLAWSRGWVVFAGVVGHWGLRAGLGCRPGAHTPGPGGWLAVMLPAPPCLHDSSPCCPLPCAPAQVWRCCASWWCSSSTATGWERSARSTRGAWLRRMLTCECRPCSAWPWLDAIHTLLMPRSWASCAFFLVLVHLSCYGLVMPAVTCSGLHQAVPSSAHEQHAQHPYASAMDGVVPRLVLCGTFAGTVP